MTQQARTPRQRPGDELVALSVMVTPATKTVLAWLAEQDRRSLSQVGRMAIEAYVEQRSLEYETRGA